MLQQPDMRTEIITPTTHAGESKFLSTIMAAIYVGQQFNLDRCFQEGSHFPLEEPEFFLLLFFLRADKMAGVMTGPVLLACIIQSYLKRFVRRTRWGVRMRRARS